MKCYVLSDGRGNFIRKDTASGKYVPVRSFKQAYRWDTPQKAESILRNSISKSIRSDYSVREYSGTDAVEKKDLPIRSELICNETEDEDIQDWLTKLNSVAEVLTNSDARIARTVENLSKVDKEISDIQHYIEFGKFNCYQGWLCFRMLQDKLKRRRKYKNELTVLNIIRRSNIDTSEMLSLSKTITDSCNKVYNPRVLPELFREVK